jgi:hypothetical protein
MGKPNSYFSSYSKSQTGSFEIPNRTCNFNTNSALGDREYLISAGCRTRTMESVSFIDPGLSIVGFVTKVNWPVNNDRLVDLK